ncbi:MAG: phosphatidylglycerophosphatase A [Candidatus Omnitrophica bacterium]|nr:phosphatidylglycerophosphatase A [Candidatus Omnitrophota bacterium]
MWASFNRRQIFGPLGLTLLRGLMACVLPFLLFSSSFLFQSLAFVLFLIGMLTDYADGYLARKHNLVSAAGMILDPTMDKFLILIPLAVFSDLGFYSRGWLVPIFVRELVITFCRIGWALEGAHAPAEKMGKWKMGLQCVFICGCFVYLLSLHFEAAGRFQDLGILGIRILLYAMTALTLLSGMSFLYSNRENFKSVFFAKYVSAFGVGLIPYLPGTLGSLAGVGLVLLSAWNGWLYGGVFLLVSIAGYFAVNRLDLKKEHDPLYVVVDEVCGILVTFWGLPLNAPSLLFGFLLFRCFDVIKPFPLKQFEKLPGYWGIMMDDLGAGVYSWMILYFLQTYLH